MDSHHRSLDFRLGLGIVLEKENLIAKLCSSVRERECGAVLRSMDCGPDCLFGFKSRLCYLLGKLPNLLILCSIKHSTYLFSTHQETQADGGSAICNMWHLGWVSSYGLSVWVSSPQKGRRCKRLDGRVFHGPGLEGGCPIPGTFCSLGCNHLIPD